MIQQHLLQQQRLNYNHDRLLERYNRILSPAISEFRPFGTSTLPGRDYDRHLAGLEGNNHRRNSLVERSRAGVGSSSETYRLMGGGRTETLPKNVKKMVQYTRPQSVPLVHAERFEPVHVYEHPKYGPTPAYIRPIVEEQSRSNQVEDNHGERNDDRDDERVEEIFDTRSRTSVADNKATNDSHHTADEDDEETIKPPLGYMTHRDWKKKYENLIPVNPLLFNIYTKRPNGSINKYGQSLYASPPHRRHQYRSSDFDDEHDDLPTPTSSEFDSVTSDTPQGTSLSSQQKYNRLHSQVPTSTAISRPLQIMRPVKSESSDEESSLPSSPVPFLSQQKDNYSVSTPIAPPLHKRTIDQPETSPMETLADTVKNPPPPPPLLPSSLAASVSSSTTQYEKPPSVSTISVPIAPPMPDYLKPSSLTTSHPVLPNTSASETSPPAGAGSATITPGSKAVTFGNLSSPATNADAASSSSDSEDEDKQKRRRRRKRHAAGENNDDSSSDD